MNIKLLDDSKLSGIAPKVQVCLNRGIAPKDIPQYLKSTFEDINSPNLLGEDKLKDAAKLLIKCISAEQNAFIITDSDCDGLTSSAILINYLYEIFPTWVNNHLSYTLHKGKGHGINEFIDDLEQAQYNLLIVPDAGTNDIEAIERLHNVGTNVIILDHHISDVGFSPYAITINSQYDYPNPEVSGAGVVLKFCQYLDSLLGKDTASNFLDLASIGMMGDMQKITNLETKEIIFEGLQEKYIKNPLIYGLYQKNNFSLSKADYVPSPNNDLAITPMGAAFFIIPLLNAICRSGTMEEKQLVFSSMLTKEAFKEIPSNKRGHKLGEMERVVDQALRCTTNVKKRQTNNENAGMELLTSRAEEMLDDKVLVFDLQPGEVDPNIAGLVANKIMAKYQRPVCVITKQEDGSYAGSMRGYTATGIDSFKEVAEASAACIWCRG